VKKIAAVVCGLLVAALLAAPARGAENEKGKQDEKIALDQLPAAVKAAAEQAVKGIVLTEAEKATKKGEVIYEVAGKVGDKEYEIKISADGKVLKVEEADKEEEGKEGDKKGKKEKKEKSK